MHVWTMPSLIAIAGCAAWAQADYGVFFRPDGSAVVYDQRPELGMGVHGFTAEQLDLIRALGIRFLRHTMYWNQIETTETPGRYDQKALAAWDAKVKLCDEKGMILLVVVHANPPGVDFEHRQAGYERFARFMGDMAKRYPTVRYWELWNEMDVAFTDLFGARDGIAMRERGRLYVEMLRLAYPAIKQANPEAWVVTGGCSDTDEFIRGLYEANGEDCFDILNIHTYGVPVWWSFVGRGLRVREIMKEYGDADRPLWNTEFGIDAGNVVGAWGYPHTWDPPQDDAEAFDRIHREQWQRCLEENARLRLYEKVFPYQFVAGNERDDDKQIEEKAQLPAGHTIDDYGFGIMRRDGVTPRPTYEWLKQAQMNAAILAEPQRTCDVILVPRAAGKPQGYEAERRDAAWWIEGVRVDSAFPTVVRWEE